MSGKIEIKLLKHQNYLDKTGILPGYVPAIAVIDGKRVPCHQIKPEELSKIESIETLQHTISLNLEQQELDLTDLINSTQDGKNWLEGLQAQWDCYEEGPVPMNFSLKFLDFEPSRYKQWPQDSMDRGFYWRAPSRILHVLPEKTYFLDILPPMKWANGKWLPNLYYNKRAIRPNGEIEDYSLSDISDELLNVKGVLLGDLNESDLMPERGDFEGGFPRKHYLELCYPISLRRAHKEPAHIMQVFLKE